MATRPSDYINLAQLAKTIALNWQTSYPNYTVNFINNADFTALAQLFLDKTNDNANQDIIKKGNTAKLKQINQDIRKSTSTLKEYIKDSYSVNLESEYAAYGLEKTGTNYTFPTDNDRLKQRLSILLDKLREPNNPIKARNKGLTYWEDLITQHTSEWDSSKNMKSQKSQKSQECRDLQKQVSAILSKMYRQLAIDFDKNQVASVRRSFGFLNETYK